MLRVNGLFGHIQRNNLKTLALLALFLGLLEVSQFAFRLMPAAMAVNFRFAMNPASRFDNVEAGLTRRNLDPHAAGDHRGYAVHTRRAADGFGAVWRNTVARSTFFERDWYLILLIGFTYVALACWRSVVLMRHETQAGPVERQDAPELYNLVENLAVAVGLPCPKIEVIESDKLNAYAAGFFPKSSTIAVTRGLINTLTRDELEAVLAHELVHIRDRDVRLMVMARACFDLVLPISRAILGMARKRPVIGGFVALLLLSYLGLGFALIFAIIFGTIGALAFGARFAISQTREFTADAGAIELTKKPAALITALRKVARADDLPLTGFASRAMMFSSADETLLGRIIGTHPSIEARVQAVMLHGGVREYEIPATHSLPPASGVITPAAPPPAFGRKRIVHGLSGPAAQIANSIAREVPMPGAVQPAAFGRRPRIASAHTADPGQRMIAPPPVMTATETSERPASSIADWLVGHKADRVAGGIASVLMAPLFAIAYLIACFSMFVIVITLLIVKPMLGLTVIGLGIWWFTGIARRNIDGLLRLARGN